MNIDKMYFETWEVLTGPEDKCVLIATIKRLAWEGGEPKLYVVFGKIKFVFASDRFNIKK